MGALRVWISYEPRLYADLFAQVFSGVPGIRLIQDPSEGVDVAVIPLTDDGRPFMSLQTEPAVIGAKLIAVAPAGNRALVRLPGTLVWIELRPFGMERLVEEVELTRAPAPVRQARPVRRAPAPAPSMWEQLGSVFGSQPALRPMVATLAAVVLVFSMSAGTVAASQDSLPGNWLYAVKRWGESTQLLLASAERQPSLLAEFAAERVEEIAALASQGQVPQTALLDDASAELQLALAAAAQLPQDQRVAALTTLMSLTQHQEEVVTQVMAVAAPEAQAALEQALQLMASGRQTALQALSGEASAAAEPVSTEVDDVVVDDVVPVGDVNLMAGRPLYGASGSTETAAPVAGSSDTPPHGQVKTPYGQEQVPPGQAKAPPGQERIPLGQIKTPPGLANNDAEPPGQEKTPPGQEKTPPGQEKTPPGQVNTPPGQDPNRTPPGKVTTPEPQPVQQSTPEPPPAQQSTPEPPPGQQKTPEPKPGGGDGGGKNNQP